MNPKENHITVYQPNETIRMDGRLRMRRCGKDEWYDKVAFARGLAAASQFARTLLRLCFAKLLAMLVGEPDDFVAGASCAHPTRRLWRGRISGRFGDLEVLRDV